MKSSDLTSLLSGNPNSDLHVVLPDGTLVPDHFHITEVGRVNKVFIDCGGTRRELATCVLQVWVANDVDHRLKPGKLAKVMEMAKAVLGDDDLPVEIEYQDKVISQYPLAHIVCRQNSLLLVLGTKHTDCLAKDKCGVTGCC